MTIAPLPFPDCPSALKTCALRPLQPGQAAPIAQALAAMDPWRELGYPANTLAQYLLRPDPALRRYAVEVGGELAGVAAVRYPWLMGAYLELIGLFGPWQGKGLGAEIMQWFESSSFSVAPNAWVLVSSFNTRGREFYRQRGFIEIATLPDFIKPGFDEILLRKVKSD